MHINGADLFKDPRLYAPGGGQTFLGKLVVRGREPEEVSGVPGEDLSPKTEEALWEELIKEAERAEKALNAEYKKIKSLAAADEAEEEKPLRVMGDDVLSLSGTFGGVDRYHLTEGLSQYKGSGNATSAAEVREDLAARENWIFSWGRNMDMEAGGILGAHGMAPVRDDGVPGFAMRMRYDDSSTAENPVAMVETLNAAGERSAFRVALNEVNAGGATMIEAFAVMTHLGMGQGNSDGVYKGFDVAALMGTFMDRPSGLIPHDPSRDTAIASGGNTIWIPAPSQEAPPEKILDFGRRVDFTSLRPLWTGEDRP